MCSQHVLPPYPCMISSQGYTWVSEWAVNGSNLKAGQVDHQLTLTSPRNM